MTERRLTLVPEQVKEVQETTDLHTSDLEWRLAEVDGKPMPYSPVLHDRPVQETPAIGTDGRRFGTNLMPEPLSMDLGNARAYLGTFYGFDQADSMLMRAMSTGQVINGDRFKIQDSQARTQGKMSVTTDKSRPGAFTIILHILRQSGGARKAKG